MANENLKRFQVPQEPIPDSRISETWNTDVVVVGAGTSGKAAALSAAEAGAKVIQIDKHITFRWAGGMIGAFNSRLQKQKGVKLNKDEICLALMKWCGNKPDQRLYRVWADNSGAVMDWMMDMIAPEGLTTIIYQWPRPAAYDPRTEYYPDFPVAHIHSDGKTPGLNHALTLNIAQKKALQLGVDLHYQMPAVQLVRQPNGRVTSVIAKDLRNGKYIRINGRKGIILCTGDYGNNPWMVQQWCAPSAEVAAKHNIYMTRNKDLLEAPEPLNVGDGHQMGMLIGGIMEDAPHAPMSHATVAPAGANAFLRVNTLGERFENEDVPAQSQANSLVRQPGQRVWQVFDSHWEKQIPYMGVGLGTSYIVTDLLRAQVENNTVKADTIKELARKMDVPYAAFQSTIDRINELAHKGKDLDYGKRADRLTPVEKPPFYAGIVEQHILVIVGGLITNPKFQLLDKDKRPIPGIYLAGNTVGNRFAVDYPTMCPGLSHGLAWTSGRLCGLAAAAEQV